MKNFKKLASRVIALAAICVLAFGLTACGAKKKAFSVYVFDQDGNLTTFEGKTNAEYLKDAIDDIKDLTIDGSEESWGYYLTTINGLEANYDEDGAYWSLYVNNEYGNYGIDQQPVNDGDNFTFIYEVYTGEEGVG